MGLPAPKPDEVATEVDRDTRKLLDEANAAVEAWSREVDRLKAKMQEEMGEATAALVDGQLVATYRPKQTWREKALRDDYPHLVEHYMETEVTTVFNVKAFAEAHPDIAEQYQTREFRLVK